MAPSSPVRIVDEEGKPITASNPLPVTGGGGGGGGGGDASAANQVTMIAHLADIEAATEAVAGTVNDDALKVDVDTVAIPSAVVSGQKTVTSAGTAEPLVGSSTPVSGVTIKALHDNQGMIYVGDSSVDSTSGFVLDAGESVFVEIDDLDAIYIDADQASDGVSFLAS